LINGGEKVRIFCSFFRGYYRKIMRDFVHLHVHTEYSLLDGVSQIIDRDGNPGDLLMAAQASHNGSRQHVRRAGVLSDLS